MMYETSSTQSRPVSVRRARRKRYSKSGSYHNTSRSSRSPIILTPDSSPSFGSPRSLNHQQTAGDTFQAPVGPGLDLQFCDYFDLTAAATTTDDNINSSPFSQRYNQNHHGNAHLLSHSAPSANCSIVSLPHQRLDLASLDHSPLLTQSLEMSWTEFPLFPTDEEGYHDHPAPVTETEAHHHEDLRGMGKTHFAHTESHAFDDGRLGQPYQRNDYAFQLSPSDEEFFNAGFHSSIAPTRNHNSTQEAEGFFYNNESSLVAHNPNIESSQAGVSGWTATMHQQLPSQSASSSPYPTGRTQTSFGPPTQHLDPGVNPSQSLSNRSLDLQIPGDDYLSLRRNESSSPFLDVENDGWIVASNPSSSYAVSYHSPLSQGSPHSHPSPGQTDGALHSHLFESDPRSTKPKGRQRSLTAKEKKDAREVRDAKACWACHISKTKCSPCSPGNPCAQCARLAGKRRFCKFDCFNDPLESLYHFMVPDYSMSRFQEGAVASLLSGIGWSNHRIRVRLSWGYHRTVDTDVVAIAVKDQASNPLIYQHQVLANGQDRPTLMRKRSPLLGVPSDVTEGMESSHSKYLQDIVDNDLYGYVRDGAYNENDSSFSGKLLWAISSFYLRCARSDVECSLLRQSIEMHITSTILQRSLILDDQSMQTVQLYLHQYFPDRSAPKCAGRQVKLAFFMLQRQRIVSILKEWGNLMWTIHNSANNAEKWALGFSVFIMLTLVIDKTLGAAYSLCESRIEHRDAEVISQRNEFRNLVRLSEKELFGRCKEIFHWKFKTRKAGKEACNPIRDGMDAFKGRAVSDAIAQLVEDLRTFVGDFDSEIRSHKTLARPAGNDVPYTDCGRLACIFLDDFLDHN